MRPIERFLEALGSHGCEPRRSGKGWSAKCPAHNDQRPSLSVHEGDDGRVLVKCHAGCETKAVCEGIGKTVIDLFLRGSMMGDNNNIVAEYDYCDEQGEMLLQVVRYKPKWFKQRRPRPNGGWEWSVKGVRTIPYRLPELLADTTRLVVVVEGEKDADNLATIGVLATCNAGGAGKWSDHHAKFLHGRQVLILPHNDDVGRGHAELVARTLNGLAETVRILELPNLPKSGDVSDWLAAGGTKEVLERLAEEVSEWMPTPMPAAGPILTCVADVEARPVSWLWPGHIPLGRITLLVGRPGEGKSFLTTDIAARVTTGSAWPDGSECPEGSVILISAEDDPADTIRPRLDAHNADVQKVQLLWAVRTVDGNGQHERMISLADVGDIEAALVQYPDCKLVVVDPIGSFLGDRTDANRDNEVRGILAPIAAVAEKHGVAILIVAHRRKSTGSNADDLALGSRAFTGIARAVWHLTRDPETKGRRLLLPGKNNLAVEDGGLAFSIAGDPPCLKWEHDSIAMSADDALAAENQQREQKYGPEAEALKAAQVYLRSALSEGPRLAKELIDEWCNGHGGSKRTLERAKKALAVGTFRLQVPGPWWWQLPANNANATEIAGPDDLGDVAEIAAFSTFDPAGEGKDARLQHTDVVGSERVQVTI